jgi:methionyl-tRNA formyltransferase
MTNYLIASSKDWFKAHPKSIQFSQLNVFEITQKEELNLEYLETINPRYIFFPHWNWKVSADIYERFECVVFHTAPLPYGRGGSPIQHLILNGLKKSPVCAIKMTDILDGGPIYDSLEVSLEGTISEIFTRIADRVEKLIVSICQHTPHPKEQVGEPVAFKRLSTKDNELLSSHSIHELYDRIRMVDGGDYPKAYISFGDYKIEVTAAEVAGTELQAKIRLYRNDN